MVGEHVFDPAYSRNPGCCQRVSHGGSPHQCGRPEAAAVPWRYKYPRPHATRLYVCADHARLTPAAEALTQRDRAIITARHDDRRRALERAARLDLIVDRSR